jgi:hypothetical protein
VTTHILSSWSSTARRIERPASRVHQDDVVDSIRILSHFLAERFLTGVRSMWARDTCHLRQRCFGVFERFECGTAPMMKPVGATSLWCGFPRVFDVPFEFLLADVCRRESNMVSELSP